MVVQAATAVMMVHRDTDAGPDQPEKTARPRES